jgi:rubrerythrin
MTQTTDNLRAAFAGESQANRRYLAFARKADDEGFPQIARLFRAAAHAETVHALNHLRTVGDVKTTAENLQTAVNGENYEATTMYPDFIKEAESEGDRKAIHTFNYALEAEKVHEMLYRQALDSIGKEQDTYEYYVCPVCGFTHARNAPDKCPVCNTLGSRFEKVS